MNRVLLIGAPFYSYLTLICRALTADGLECRTFETPQSSACDRARKICGLKSSVDRRGYQELTKVLLEFQPELVVVINAMIVSDNIAAALNGFDKAEKRLYLWDSANACSRLASVASLFDEVITFDPADAEAYGYRLRPLFYTKTCEANSGTTGCSFVGMTHSGRHDVLSCLGRQLEDAGLPYKFYEMLRGKPQYYYHRFIKRDIGHASIADIHYSSLSYEDAFHLMCEFSSIIDIEKVGQIGLTMRSIESIGAHRKLITTNPHVADYDFYRYGNVLIIDRESPSLDLDFLREPYHDVPEDVLGRYSIRQFARDLVR